MAGTLENPDRNVSADGAREDFEFMKRWIAESHPALPYNQAAKFRIGRAITEHESQRLAQDHLPSR